MAEMYGLMHKTSGKSLGFAYFTQANKEYTKPDVDPNNMEASETDSVRVLL